MKTIAIGQRTFEYLSPYIVAEVGVNHEGDLQRAKAMIEAAADGGAHAVKFQTYKADLLATKDSSPAYWDLREESAESQHELFSRWDVFGHAEYSELADHCQRSGVDFLSTPFDLQSVDLVADLSPALKVASADVTNVPLLRRIGSTSKQIIMSVGAARYDEVAVALRELRTSGAGEIALLHCVLNYPTPPEAAQLAQMGELQRLFGDGCCIGYSDHVKTAPDGTMPALEAALLLGAVVLEKHFTDDKHARGNDHYHAMDAADLSRFCDRVRTFRELIGSRTRDLSGEASAITNARRRIVTTRRVAAGETLLSNDVCALRSNRGIEISHWDRVVGHSVRQSVEEGVPLDWADLK